MKKVSFPILAIFLLLSADCSCQTKGSTMSLNIKAFQIIGEKGKVGMSMDNDGNLFMDAAKVAKISPSGDITVKDQGLIASYHNDTLYTFGKQESKTRIDRNGSIYQDGAVFVYWNSAGNFTRENDPSVIKISPNDPTLYVTASVVLWLYLNVGVPAAK